MSQITRQIKGIHCQNCVKKITSELSAEFGPIAISEDLSTISFSGDEAEFCDALADLGFELLAKD